MLDQRLATRDDETLQPNGGAQPQLLAIERLAPALSLLAAGLLGWMGQSALDQNENPPLAWTSLSLAALLFLFAVRGVSAEQPVTLRRVSQTGLRLVPLAGSLVLGALSFLGSGGNEFRPTNVIPWVVSLVLFLFAVDAPVLTILPRRISRLISGSGWFLRWETMALIAITLLGAFLRTYHLNTIPAEMGPDLPLKYGNVEQVLKGDWPIFFTSYPGREALFFYLTAILARFIGLSHITIKLSVAIIGTATIPILYAVARRLYNAQVGLIAAFLLAVSHFHIIQSRFGYRAVLVPLFSFVLLYLAVRIFQHGRPLDFALAGMWLGLGQYTYNSFLVAPFGFVAAVAAFWLAKRELPTRELLRGLGLSLAAGLLVYAPLARFALDDPTDYFQRIASRMTSTETPVPANVLAVLTDNIRRTFLMLNYRGDVVYTENVPLLRELGFISAILFILGLAYTLYRWRKGSNLLLLILFATLLLPSALAVAFPQEVPNANRSGGGIALAILMAAPPLWLILRRVQALFPQLSIGPIPIYLPGPSGHLSRLRVRFASSLTPAFALLLLLLLARETVDAYHTYFTDYVNAQPSHNYSISLSLAQAIDDYAGNGPVFVKYWPYWYDGHALRVQFQRTPRDWAGESEDWQLDRPPFTDFHGHGLFIVHPDDKQAQALLRSFFPNAIAVNHFDPSGSVQFISFYGEK